jgi:hypothetical protein
VHPDSQIRGSRRKIQIKTVAKRSDITHKYNNVRTFYPQTKLLNLMTASLKKVTARLGVEWQCFALSECWLNVNLFSHLRYQAYLTQDSYNVGKRTRVFIMLALLTLLITLNTHRFPQGCHYDWGFLWVSSVEPWKFEDVLVAHCRFQSHWRYLTYVFEKAPKNKQRRNKSTQIEKLKGNWSTSSLVESKLRQREMDHIRSLKPQLLFNFLQPSDLHL